MLYNFNLYNTLDYIITLNYTYNVQDCCTIFSIILTTYYTIIILFYL